jgi:hypothetical protein
MRVTCERCLRRYDVPDATVKGRKIRARCKCGARVIVQDEERAARSSAAGAQTTGSIQRPVRWFVDITSWEPIAMDLRQLVRAFDGGRIDADTLVWRKGMPDWRRLRDVAELAERLMGADPATKNAAEAQVDPATMASEPPPRQPERPRTPPASYSVGESDERAARKALAPEDDVNLAQSAPAEHTERSPGHSLRHQLPGERFASGAGVLQPGTTGRFEGPLPIEQDLGAVAGPANAEVRSVPPRTITQTGLSAPPPELPRAMLSPPVRELKVLEADGDARVSVSASAVAPSPRPREVRSSTPAGGQRRTLSSDETPAQKPSSISVPPGALAGREPRIRKRYLAAVAGVAIAAAFLLYGALSTDSATSASVAPASEPRAGNAASGAPDLQSRQGALAPIPAAPTPSMPEPPVAGLSRSAATSPSGASAPLGMSKATSGAAMARKDALTPQATGSGTASVAGLPGGSAGSKTASAGLAATSSTQVIAGQARPGPVAVSASQARPGISPPNDAAAKPPRPEQNAQRSPNAAAMGGAGAGGARAGGAGAGGATEHAQAPLSASPMPGNSPGVAPTPGQKSSSVPAPASANPSAAAGPPPFDGKLARQQLEIAASKASTCGSHGPTRGAGDVNVTIESWGRVVRVTHLNPAFVDTPVGLCVTQAFQQVQVPRFSGGPQSLSGSFVVQ